MIRPTLTALLALALSAPATAATLSVLPLDGDGLFQDPEGLVLDQLRKNAASAQHERDVDNNRDNGQSFTITAATVIDKIAISYSVLAADGTDTTFEFFRVANPLASTLTPDGGIIDSITFNGSDPAFGGNAAGTLIFDVANTAAAAGDAFAIRFDTAGGTSHTIKWEILDNSTAASYPGGMAYENGSQFNKVYSFGVIAVPEPASLTLLALGGLLLARKRPAHA